MIRKELELKDQKIVALLIRSQVNMEYTLQKYQNNLKELKKLQKQVEALQRDDKQLTDLCQQTVYLLHLLDQKSPISIQREIQLNQPPERISLQQRQQNDGNIQVVLPDLVHLQNFFHDASSEELINKYIEVTLSSKNQSIQHEQTIMKLTAKLQSVEAKVNEALIILKNQRRAY